MVEVVYICHGSHPPHEAKREFKEPISWPEVTMWLKSEDPRCDAHPQWSNNYYDE